MNDVSAAVSAALPLIESLFALGLPGILILLASIPALAVVLVFLLDYRHGKRIERVLGRLPAGYAGSLADHKRKARGHPSGKLSAKHERNSGIL